MKKNYSKPEIVFESFKLTTSIANTCGGMKGNHDNGDSCELVIEDSGDKLTVFNTGLNSDCEDVNCYHVTSASPDVFAS